MADYIEVPRKWLQEPPKASWVHFDISAKKKRLALELGAKLTDKYGPVEYVARLRGDTKKLESIKIVRRMIKRKQRL